MAHTVQLVLLLRTLPGMCLLPMFVNSDSGGSFAWASQLAGRAAGAAGYLVGAPDPATGSSAAPAQQSLQQCDCMLVLGTLQVLLGFVLPTFLLSVWDGQERAAFVAARLHQRWVQADLRKHLMHDWLQSCVVFAALQPLAFGLVWRAVVLAAVKAGVC